MLNTSHKSPHLATGKPPPRHGNLTRNVQPIDGASERSLHELLRALRHQRARSGENPRRAELSLKLHGSETHRVIQPIYVRPELLLCTRLSPSEGNPI